MDRQCEIAWAAGFLDGEACFYLAKTGRATMYTRSPAVKATQVFTEPLEILRRLFGGSVRPRNAKTSTGKTAYDWLLKGGDNLREFLPLVIPFLTVKRPQAEVLLGYANSMRVEGRGSYALTSEELSERCMWIDRFAQARDVSGQ